MCVSVRVRAFVWCCKSRYVSLCVCCGVYVWCEGVWVSEIPERSRHSTWECGKGLETTNKWGDVRLHSLPLRYSTQSHSTQVNTQCMFENAPHPLGKHTAVNVILRTKGNHSLRSGFHLWAGNSIVFNLSWCVCVVCGVRRLFSVSVCMSVYFEKSVLTSVSETTRPKPCGCCGLAWCLRLDFFFANCSAKVLIVVASKRALCEDHNLLLGCHCYPCIHSFQVSFVCGGHKCRQQQSRCRQLFVTTNTNSFE